LNSAVVPLIVQCRTPFLAVKWTLAKKSTVLHLKSRILLLLIPFCF